MIEAQVAERPRRSLGKRLLFWQITLLPTYTLCGVALIFAASLETAKLGPYTTWYNQHLKQRAQHAGLVGTSEARVEQLLGRADNIMRFWEVLGPDGKPAPDAHFVITYAYYPYPFLPFSKFQVHCTGGVVRVLEMFDD